MDQSDVIAFLSSGAAFSARAEDVETVETHGAHVFLCGDVALKLKRAVVYDYMDLGTVERRHAMLLRERELNAPTAPMIYRDVVPVTLQADGLALGGNGPVVDWVLRMWRFPAAEEFEAIAERGDLDDALAIATGEAVAAYHATVPVIRRSGGDLIADILAELGRVFAGFDGAAGTDRVGDWQSGSSPSLARVRDLLDLRGRSGHVRRAHGDLHLRNLVRIQGRPILFDALEFDETLGTCDVLYDLAFLVMDLIHRGLDRQACRVLDAWLREARGTEDPGLAALPLFLSVRAAIRAMVLLQTDAARDRPGASAVEIRAYLALACRALHPPAPSMAAIGGYSGTGKSVLARALAPGLGAMPGAVLLSSDLERKAGLRKDAPLGKNAYAPAHRVDVYRRMLARAGMILASGQSVILDATFLDPGLRNDASDLARRLSVSFHGLWLEAPADILKARLRIRRGDPSDADVEVLCQQLAKPIGSLDWRRLEAVGPPEHVLGSALRALSDCSPIHWPDV